VWLSIGAGLTGLGNGLASQPVAVIADDLQWLDQPSREAADGRADGLDASMSFGTFTASVDDLWFPAMDDIVSVLHSGSEFMVLVLDHDHEELITLEREPRPEKCSVRAPAGACQTGNVETSEVSQPAGGAAADVAGIVQDRNASEFVARLRLADRHFTDDSSFERSVVQVLQGSPELIALWAAWSRDQRWTPSAYMEGNEVGWYDGARRNLKVHPDAASAAADFIHRLAVWLARGEIL
jgi:hypothetical protein